MSLRRKAALAVAVAASRGRSRAVRLPRADRAGCTQTIGYDASIPTWDQYWAAHPDQDAVTPFGWGKTGSGGGTRSIPTGAAPRARRRSAAT